MELQWHSKRFDKERNKFTIAGTHQCKKQIISPQDTIYFLDKINKL